LIGIAENSCDGGYGRRFIDPVLKYLTMAATGTRSG